MPATAPLHCRSPAVSDGIPCWIWQDAADKLHADDALRLQAWEDVTTKQRALPLTHGYRVLPPVYSEVNDKWFVVLADTTGGLWDIGTFATEQEASSAFRRKQANLDDLVHKAMFAL